MDLMPEGAQLHGLLFRSMILCLVVLALSKVAASEDGSASTKTDDAGNQKLAAQYLEYMKSSIQSYDITAGAESKSPLVLEPEPLLRFTNAVSGLKAGGFFVWKTEAGRPMVGAQAFLTADDLWLHEFQSLAPTVLQATREGKMIWEPKQAGVDVRPVPRAPPPAANAVQRLVQMRELARRFGASDDFEGRERPDELRLLAKPLARFGAADAETLDGALFTLAHGTDPELLIVLEALQSGQEYQWHYSLAPMTGYALKATLDDQPVWEVPWRRPPFDMKDSFYLLVHRQSGK